MILKELRTSHHLSQKQLAQLSGLNVRTIPRIENHCCHIYLTATIIFLMVPVKRVASGP
ncbi:MAG: helix-turn-helix transcriptional regulator [bacterium]|nr:XRE family transcriptional regulator [Gammaproteobacteria bacterium]